MSRITKSTAIKNLDEHFSGIMCCQKEWAYIRSYINEAGRTVRAKPPVQQAKAAITLLDKLQAWDNGDLPGSTNMVDAVISEWRKVKAAVR